jgi:hypothetical protein
LLLLPLVVAACGGRINDDAPPPLRPPVCTPATSASYPATYPGAGTAFVVRKLFYGNTDMSGVSSTQAWKKYGENIDGIASSRDKNQGECRPLDGASPANRDDGDDGIDNSFGHVLVPFIAPFVGDATEVASAAIEAGGRTPIILVGAWPHGEDARAIDTGFAYAEKTSTPPRWDGTDARSLAASWTNGARPAVSFANAYACDHELASGEATAAIQIELRVLHDDTGILRVALHRPHIRMTIAPDGRTATGYFSGVLATEEVTRAFQDVAGAISKELCSGSTLDSVIRQIREASDILVDGSQDPNQDCNGISLGMGFEAVAATPSDIAPAEPPPENACAP